jgi:hypothetical protein
MKNKFGSVVALLIVLATSACGSTSDSQDRSPEGRRQQWVAKGECTFEACSSVPSSFEGEARVQCSKGDGEECEWSADGNDGSVSYAPCEDRECPARPAIDCPADHSKSQQCGNENNAGCAWTTVCVPPRETTPCPSSNGCDGQPVLELGVICSDGSTGGFVCVTDDERCYWERSCD